MHGHPMTRRDALWHLGGGLGGVAFTTLLARDGLAAAPARPPHHPAKAARVVQLFCPGGLSHLDTFDHKPELEERAGQPFDPDGRLAFFASKPGHCRPSDWPFARHGGCGKAASALFPELAGCVDALTFVHSMQSKSALHGPAMFMMNSGFTRPGFPSMGAWVTYGLGSEADDLPAFVVLPDPRGYPRAGRPTGGPGSCRPSTRGRRCGRAVSRRRGAAVPTVRRRRR